ncbi:uncharacterized protein V6R79_015076 [Siganus canaliculatus]
MMQQQQGEDRGGRRPFNSSLAVMKLWKQLVLPQRWFSLPLELRCQCQQATLCLSSSREPIKPAPMGSSLFPVAVEAALCAVQRFTSTAADHPWSSAILEGLFVRTASPAELLKVDVLVLLLRSTLRQQLGPRRSLLLCVVPLLRSSCMSLRPNLLLKERVDYSCNQCTSSDIGHLLNTVAAAWGKRHVL